jgi:hypothetical protein
MRNLLGIDVYQVLIPFDLKTLFESFGVSEMLYLCIYYVLCCRFCCPICSKSIQDMSRFWELLDQEIFLTPMPEEYRHKKVGH